MTEETKLVLGVDTTQVVKADSDLDRLAASGKRAETAAQELEAGMSRLGATSATAGKAVTAIGTATDSAAAAIGKTGQAASALAGTLGEVDAKVSGTAAGMQRVGEATGQAARQFEGIGAASRSAAEGLIGQAQATAGVSLASEKAAAAYRLLEDATVKQQATQAGLSRATLAAAAAQDEYNRLAATAGTSQQVIAAAAVKAESAQAALAAATLASARAQESSQKANSAYQAALGQTAAATKLTAFQAQQLGFQLNDLFVQIASGQSPLTALIQQGSQLSGTFGGIRATFAALATVFTPVRLAIGGTVGALAGLALLAKSGADESANLARSLAITGNAAGLTEGRFNALSASISRSTNTSIGSAREALQALAASGRLSGDAFAETGEAVQRFALATGQSTADVAKQFSNLTNGVSRGAEELNRTYNFLTASQVEYIRELESQGKTQEAVRLTMEALSARIGDQSQNLGFLERAWNGVKTAVSGAADAIKDIGRASTAEQQLAKLQNSLTISEKGIYTRGDAAGYREQILALQEVLRLQARSADEAARRAATEQAGIKFLELQTAALSAQEQLAQKLRNAFEIGTAANKTAEEISAIQAQIAKTSSAAADGFGEALAKIEAGGAAAAQRLAGKLQGIQAQLDQGLIRQVGYIEAVARAEVEALRAEQSRIGASLALAQSESERISLRGAAAAKAIEIANREQKAVQDVTTQLYRQSQAIQAVTLAMRQQEDAEWLAYVQQSGQAVKETAEALQDYRQSLEDSAEATRIELAFGAENNAQQKIELENLRIKMQLRRQLQSVDRLTFAGLTPDQAEAQRQILRDGFNQAAAKESAERAAKITADAFAAVRADITNTLTDALIEGGQAGRDAIERLFKNLVLRPIVQAVVGDAVGSVSGLLGFGGGVSATGTNSGLGAVQAAQSLASIYKTGSAAYGYLTGGTMAGTAATNAALAESAVGTAGYGASSASGASALSGISSSTWAAAIVAGIYKANQDYSAGFGISQARDVGRETGGLSGTFEGLQAGIFKSLGFSDRLASLLSGSTAVAALIGRAAPQVTARGITGTLSGGDFSGSAFADIFEKGGLFRSDKRTTQTAALPDDIGRFLDDAASGVFAKAKSYGEALGLPGEALSNITSELKITLSDDAEKNKTAILEALSGYGDALVQGFADQVKPLQQYGETVAQTIERVGGALSATNAVLDQIGVTALKASIGGGQAAIDLQNLFGGASGLQQAASGYFDNFFTEPEKTAAATEQLTKAFGDVGLAVPSTREAFKSLVSGLDLTSEAGRAQFGVLLSLQGVFADLVPAAESAAVAVRSASDILRERSGLETERLRLQGDTAAIRALERDSLDASNRSIYDQINALKDLQEANAAAAETARLEATQRSGLETQLLTLQGNTAALRERERAAISESNRALYDQIIALQDQAEAAQRAADIAQERNSLERQLLQLQGDTAALRALDREALNESNRALFDQIAALSDLNDANAKAAQSAKEAADAADRLAESTRNQRLSLEEQLLRLQGNTTALRERERVGLLDDYNRSLFDQINALTDAQAALAASAALAQAFARNTDTIGQGLQSAFGEYTSALETERGRISQQADDSISTLNQQADAARSAFDAVASSLGGLVDSLNGTVSNILGEVSPELSRARALDTLNAAYSTLRNGGTVDAQAVQDAAGVAARSDPGRFASAVDARREALRTALLIGNVSSAAQRQIDLAKAQSETQIQKTEETIAAITKSRDEQLSALDEQLNAATKQYEQLTGIRTGILGVQDAIAQLAQAMAAFSGATGRGAPTNQVLVSGSAATYLSSTGAIATGIIGNTVDQALIRGLSGQTATGQEVKSYISGLFQAGDIKGIRDFAVREGLDSTSLDDLFGFKRGSVLSYVLSKGLPAFAEGGLFGGGARLVGERGPEIAVTGPERIYSFDQLMTMASGRGRDAALVAEIKALREEVATLRQQQQASSESIAISSDKTARLLEKFDIDGLPDTRA